MDGQNYYSQKVYFADNLADREKANIEECAHVIIKNDGETLKCHMSKKDRTNIYLFIYWHSCFISNHCFVFCYLFT